MNKNNKLYNRKITGVVYMIINCVNGKKYIGRDANDNRFYLGGGEALAIAKKKYGTKNFIKITLRRCKSVRSLVKWEQYFLDLYNAAENRRMYNESPFSTVGGTRGKKVYQYDLEGNYIASFKNSVFAAKAHGVSYKAINSVLTGRVKSSCGFFWSYKKEDKVNVVKPAMNYIKTKKPEIRPVYYYDENGVYKGRYDNISIASRDLGINIAYINKSCKGCYKTKTKYNAFFSFEKMNVLPVQNGVHGLCRAVSCTRISDGEYFEFSSITSASKELGILCSAIGNAAGGLSHSSGGFVWKYKNDAA